MDGSPPDLPATGLSAWIRRAYDWTLSWADGPWGPLALFVLAFCESSWFPIPPDPLLIALCLGAARRSLGFAALCTAASVLGGLFGYWIGASFFDLVGAPILETYGKLDDVEALRDKFRAGGDLAVFVAALTPIPYKLVTITAGAAGMSVPGFIMASIIGRGLRFFALASLIWWKGETIAAFIDAYFEKLAIAFAVLLVGGFVVLRAIAGH